MSYTRSRIQPRYDAAKAAEKIFFAEFRLVSGWRVTLRVTEVGHTSVMGEEVFIREGKVEAVQRFGPQPALVEVLYSAVAQVTYIDL